MIRFNAFAMNAVGHQSPGMWRHPDDQTSRYAELGFWTDLAKLLERGLFDGIFLADVLGVYDTYGGSADAPLRAGAQVPINDPLLLVPVMAAVTEHLGFGVTVNTSSEHPYVFARRMSTLDHLTRGRVGWNLVTGYLPSASRNLGAELREHDERYDHAEEYLAVTRKLWEQSWEDDAAVRDVARGVFTDPSKVHPIEHRGRWFDVPGIHLAEPSPQRTPVIYQAGASARGTVFAGRHAEVVYAGGGTVSQVAETVRRFRAALVEAGRQPEDALVYTKVTVVTAPSAAEARDKHRAMLEHADVEGALALVSGWIGTDLSRYDLDDPVEVLEGNAMQTYARSFTGTREDGRPWTVRDLAKHAAIGGLGGVLVGSAEEVADYCVDVTEATGVDGFNLSTGVTPGTFADVIDLVVPILQERGVYRTSYEPGTLRHKLLGRGDRSRVPVAPSQPVSV